MILTMACAGRDGVAGTQPAPAPQSAPTADRGALPSGYSYLPAGEGGDQVELSPPRHLRIVRAGKSYEGDLLAEGMGNAYNVADVRAVLLGDEVQAALLRQARLGLLDAAAERGAFILRHGGKRLLIGAPCPAGRPGCEAIPPALARLALVLRAVHEHQSRLLIPR